MVTDGDKDPSPGSFVEFGPGVQWEEINLEATHEIFAIVIWHYFQAPWCYHDVIVKVSDDNHFLKDVKTVFNNDNDNSAELGAGFDHEYFETYEGRLLDCKGIKGRYVRLYSNGNDRNDKNHLIEVEVYGCPAK